MISKLRLEISNWAHAQAVAQALRVRAYRNRRDPGGRVYLDDPAPEDLEALAQVMREMQVTPGRRS